MSHDRRYLGLVVAAVVVGCGEPTPTESRLPPVPAPVLASQSGGACVPSADFVVHDGDELLEALAAASEGSVIALDGMIEIWFDTNIFTPGLTLTCHSPGSGLAARPGVGIDFLVIARAERLRVDHLVLDATEAIQGAFLAEWDGEETFGNHVTFTNNEVRCVQPTDCVGLVAPTFAAAEDATIVENHFHVSGVANGVHVQGFDRVAVEGNVLESDDESGSAIAVNGSHNVHVNANHVRGAWRSDVNFFDGVVLAFVSENHLEGSGTGFAFRAIEEVLVARNTVRCGPASCAFVRDGGVDVTVEGNTFVSHGSTTGLHVQSGIDGVRILGNRLVAHQPSGGPAFGGIRLREIAGAVVSENVIEGPWANGIALSRVGDTSVSGNRIRGVAIDGIRLDELHDSRLSRNRVYAPGVALLLTDGCGNAFLGNMLQGDTYAAAFEEPTGANVLVGGPAAVVDNGALDCDGDGTVDPNQITSGGRILHGPSLARAVIPAGGPLR